MLIMAGLMLNMLISGIMFQVPKTDNLSVNITKNDRHIVCDSVGGKTISSEAKLTKENEVINAQDTDFPSLQNETNTSDLSDAQNDYPPMTNNIIKEEIKEDKKAAVNGKDKFVNNGQTEHLGKSNLDSNTSNGHLLSDDRNQFTNNGHNQWMTKSHSHTKLKINGVNGNHKQHKDLDQNNVLITTKVPNGILSDRKIAQTNKKKTKLFNIRLLYNKSFLALLLWTAAITFACSVHSTFNVALMASHGITQDYSAILISITGIFLFTKYLFIFSLSQALRYYLSCSSSLFIMLHKHYYAKNIHPKYIIDLCCINITSTYSVLLNLND